MKITELMRNLIETLKEYGDIEVGVAVDKDDGGYYYGIPRWVSDVHDDNSVDILCDKATYE